ncbi:RNA polymerase sigma factor [Chondrinema litorale]|uniref:RNA polymerase sigma factor n=1 Tax=Chondrinema litorale TaxID=2994555 RepID=UPI0025437FD5|nr:sigma-70 family RNA polymerase sigma factor [Chondrinema litorale]UZS00206.1 sigma-70 family RNA polymerase sigma factor [Chondrinema litorale]
MTENDLLSKIKSGDESILEYIYLEYRSEFLIWLSKKFNCSEEDSRDIYQVSIIIFYENIIQGKLIQLNSSLKTYLFSIGKNKMLEKLRKENIIINDLISYQNIAQLDSELLKDFEEDLVLVLDCLRHLGQKCIELITSFYYKKKSFEDIAKQMGYDSAKVARNQKYKCMNKLREQVLSKKK